MPTTPEQRRAAISTVLAVTEAIRELGSVPSGELYARVMAHMDIHGYEAIIAMLKRAKVVEEKSNVLSWIGPLKGVSQ